MRHLDNLMQREMSRKEFLTILALGLMSVLGMETIIKLLTGKRPSDRLNRYMTNPTNSTYGNK